MDSATTTAVQTAPVAAPLQRSRPGATETVANGSNGSSDTKDGKVFIRRYRHVMAIHSKTRPSTLSHDSEAAPSFIGFRNLMVIVLGTNKCNLMSEDSTNTLLVVGNVRLIIENIQKVDPADNIPQTPRQLTLYLVWQSDMPDLPRFPTTGSSHRIISLHPHPLLPLGCAYDRAVRSPAGEGVERVGH